ncbi:MAG: DUF4160 domain-containing protein [Phycisphaeraceae bacterium]
MPTVLRIGPYSFVFFSSDRPEPMHIHVKRDASIVKYWIDPVSLAKNIGFSSHELKSIERLVQEHREQFIEAWHDYFGA